MRCGNPRDSSTTNPVGAGGHYLQSSNCPAQMHHAGTTNINAALLSRLSQKTTYPPVVLTSNFTANTTLAPIVPRDDAGAPDVGFHYDPIDFAWSGVTLTNATLTLTNGVGGCGIRRQGSHAAKRGEIHQRSDPVRLNHLTRYDTVQEQANTNWSASSTATIGLLDLPPSQPPSPAEIRVRFSDLSMLGNSPIRRYLYNNLQGGSPGVFSSENCQWRGLNLDGRCYSSSGMTFSLTNNLIHRCTLSFDQAPAAGYFDFTLNGYNNLFLRGVHSFTYDDPGTNAWTVKDNLFDCDGINLGTYSFIASNNGFRSGLTPFGSNNQSITNFDYQMSFLGEFYYPTNGTI
jgi:hypothetical protein